VQGEAAISSETVQVGGKKTPYIVDLGKKLIDMGDKTTDQGGTLSTEITYRNKTKRGLGGKKNRPSWKK